MSYNDDILIWESYVRNDISSEFLNAYKSNDIITGNRIISNLAKSKFKNSVIIEPLVSSKQDRDEQPRMVVHHGTTKKFNKFESGRPTKNDFGWLGTEDTNRHGIFFAENPVYAKTFTYNNKDGSVLSVYLNITNPLYLDSDSLSDMYSELSQDDSDYNMIRYLWMLKDKWEAFDGEDGKNFILWLKSNNYDGCFLNEEGHGIEGSPAQNVWVVFDSNQVKSSNPFTVDDSGELIPLNKRFDFSNADIRY